MHSKCMKLSAFLPNVAVLNFVFTRNQTIRFFTRSAVVAMIGVSWAEASIIYSPVNESVSFISPSKTIEINGQAFEFGIVHGGPGVDYSFFTPSEQGSGVFVSFGNEDDVRNFTLGDTISTLTAVGKMYPTAGSANDYLILHSNSDPSAPGNFPANGRGYAGFLLGGPLNFNYGWAQFELLTVGEETVVTFLDYAWENTVNASIEVGAVPEPSTYALLGIALAGLAAHVLRRRRAA